MEKSDFQIEGILLQRIQSKHRVFSMVALSLLVLFGPGFFPTLKDRAGAKWPTAITPLFQVRWSWNLVTILNGSCLHQYHIKSWWCHRYFNSMTSSSFLCMTPKTSNFSNFHRIKLKFCLGVDFKFRLKNWIKVKIWRKKASFVWFWSSTASIDVTMATKKRLYLTLSFER